MKSKLPWYMKEGKMTFEDGKICWVIKVSNLYILLKTIQLWFCDTFRIKIKE